MIEAGDVLSFNGRWGRSGVGRDVGRRGGMGAKARSCFADGHGELPNWRDLRTSPKVFTLEEAYAVGWGAADNPDYAWLWERTNGGLPSQ